MTVRAVRACLARNRTTREGLRRVAAWTAVIFGLGLPGALSVLGATAPASYGDVQNRVLVIRHPNGAMEAYRVLPGGTFEAAVSGPSGTVSASYSTAGLPADQGRLVLAWVTGTGAATFGQTNRLTLTFQTSTNGTYVREYNNSNLPAFQRFEGPFELSTGPNIVPIIGTGPESAAVGAGRNPSLAVSAVGFSLSYQWFRDGQAIAGATQRMYSITSFSAASAGSYHVVVSNPLGSATSQPAVLQLASAPVIVRQPVAVTAYEGGSARFTVEASGVPAPGYEWLFRGVRMSAAANAPVLELKNLTAAMAGEYSVRVSNGEGTVTSEPALLGVQATTTNALYRGRPWVKVLASRDPVPGHPNTFGPLKSPYDPQFTLRDQTVHVIVRGDNDVPANAAGPIHRGLFRWRDGALTTLVYTNTPRPGGGTFGDVFYLTDEEAGGVNFGSGSMYEIRGGVVTEVIGSNTLAPGRDLKLGGTGSYARRGSAVAISSSILAANGVQPVGAGMYLLDGQQLSRICDDTTDLPGVMPGYGGRPTEDSVNLDAQTIVFSTIAGPGGAGGVFRSTYGGAITKLLDTGDRLPGLTNLVVGFGDVDVEGGLVFAVVGTRTGNPPNFGLVNRAVAFAADGTARILAIADYLVAAGPDLVYYGNSGSVVRWANGATESVIANGVALDGRRVSRVFDVEAQGDDVAVGVEFQDGTVGVYVNFGEATSGPPRILAQPQSITVPETVPASFAVAVTGAGPLTYQWRREGVPIAGATSPTLFIDSARASDVGRYDVEIRNAAGSVISTAAALTLSAPPIAPILFAQPSLTTVPVGTPAELRVLAAGAPPLTYVWRMGPANAAVPIPEADGPTYRVTLTTNAFFSVVVANASGSVTSVVAQVNLQPILTQQPQSQAVPVGGTARFEVAATGFPSFRYFWQRDGVVIAGQTNAVLTLENLQPADAGEYVATVFGTGGGTIRTTPAILRVGQGSGGPTPTPVQLGAPILVGGELRFSIPTVAGSTYDVQRTPDLVVGPWAVLQTLAGDGTAKSVVVPSAQGAGFIRVQTR